MINFNFIKKNCLLFVLIKVLVIRTNIKTHMIYKSDMNFQKHFVINFKMKTLKFQKLKN
jgi:hypothetical protein